VFFSFREKKQKIEDIKKNIRDAILVSTHLYTEDNKKFWEELAAYFSLI
jgi:hypothetical protein